MQGINGSSSVIGIGPGQSLQQRDLSTNQYGGSLQRPNNNAAILQTNVHHNPNSLQGPNVKTLPLNPHLNRFNNTQAQPNTMCSFSTTPYQQTINNNSVSSSNSVLNNSSSQTPTPPPAPAGTVQQLQNTSRAAIASTFSGMGTHV